MASLGESEYRAGGLERLLEAGHLLSRGFSAGGVYLAGRAVEAMLRALIWRHDADIRAGRKSMDAGHDLRELLGRVAALGILGDNEHRATLAADIQKVARLWSNNMRFVSSKWLSNRWRALGEIGSRRTIKLAATAYYEACSGIVKRCEILCQN